MNQAFLGKAKKQDLVLLAEELGQKVSDKMTNIDLRNIIIGSRDYEEEFVRAQLSVILEERFERENEEKIARQHVIEQQQREFEDGDIVIFLTLFERQAKRIEVEKTNWILVLLARMPSDITQLIARESEDKFDNYDYIKGVLLKRFKMSLKTFRQKFMKHQCIPARSWRDFLFEITRYFEEWLDGMEGLGSNLREDMDVCKCIVHLRHGGTLNSRRAASPLVRWVEGEEMWEASDHPHGILPQNWGETELNHSVACTVLKATANDRRHLALCHDKFHGPRPGLCQSVGVDPLQGTSVSAVWCSLEDKISLQDISSKFPTHVRWDLNQRRTLDNPFCIYLHFLEAPQ
ncbi:CCHC-type domain-containing protein [Trichonephila clavipes]|uniref:CCHC-type domain-containing protein n=1 Tax=Trichonephila clavipes TaxID=2585209 RepID=A0A8X6RL00_TRICX|nr:CCHC-type domain-containing protein [Trichonephila clavipes]